VGQRWRRWVPGPEHGLARGAAVYGVPRRPDPEGLRELLGRCESLRDWARLQGLELDTLPDDLTSLDEAIDRVIEEHGRHTRMSAVRTQAGLFLGTVIVSSVPGARWRLWPNGHPVVHLSSGLDLDVVAVANDRIETGQPRLADVYANAASNHSR
jgi:Family of unknown function (DUF6278)